MIPNANPWPRRILLALLLGLTWWARTHNSEDVFQDDQRIYFIEGDCYSRMTRAKMVCEGQLTIKSHDFENWPVGTTPHTTAPMDWLIAGLKFVCDAGIRLVDWSGKSPYREQTLDLAGAIVSPMLAVITAAWLWWWCGYMRLPFRSVMVFFFAVSPILVHGLVLGRPDHQSLLILVIAVAVGAELALSDTRTSARLARRWATVAGCAWGLALWTSLYEPMFFFAGAIAWHAWANRVALFSKSVRSRWVALAAFAAVALLVDGWRLSWPDQTLERYFSSWASSIGELKHLDLRTGLVWQWMGLFWISAPALLWLAGRRDPRARGVLPLLLVMLALTIWQLRWGYFVALAAAFTIPWQLAALERRWAGWLFAVLAHIPLLWGWSATLNPSQATREDKARKRAVRIAYRDVAEQMRRPERAGFIAPWWVSPEIAYWSGQPGVAGTSHQSLAGIVDTAKFFTSTSEQEAAAILRERKVRWVIADDLALPNTKPAQYPQVNNSARILGIAIPWEPMGWLLAESANYAPPYLRFINPEERGLVLGLAVKKNGKLEQTSVKFYDAQYLKVYEVIPGKL